MAKSRIKKIVILLLNLLLYIIYGKSIIPILFTSIITFYLGRIIKKNKNPFLVAISYLTILMPLVFYKYLVGIMQLSFLVPLGISYYTLALISYVSDIYHDRYNPSNNIIDFMLFSLYFPCLFIGPINRYNEFTKKIDNIKFNKDDLFKCILRISLGLIKKFIVANKLGVIIFELSLDTSLTGLHVLFGCIVYSIYLYCDFSGGIDMVLGISKIFNIDLVENFDKPYLSQSIKEFWRRWHISLGTWLKDYIYIPMGGNRGSKISTTINVLFTFFISGAWHGIHYILWGIINGILVVFNFKTKYKVLNIILTLITISLLWIFFIYNNTLLSLKMFISIFSDHSFNIWNFGLNSIDYVIVIIFTITVFIYEIKKDVINNVLNNVLNKVSFNKKLIIVLIIILLILVFGSYGLDVNSNNFVYGSF